MGNEERMIIGHFELTKCEKPDTHLIGVKHVQTKHGPADWFMDAETCVLYMRLWLNDGGLNVVEWFEVTDAERMEAE
jgi:hypothetical protein